MRKELLCAFLLLSLVGCSSNTTPSNSTEDNSSLTNITSEVSSNDTSIDDSLSNDTGSSVESSSVSSIVEDKTDYYNGYPYHPTSEPSYKKQLQVLNYIGDINSVWNHYRGEGVSLAVIDSGFDINHPEFKNRDGSSRISDRSVYISTTNGKTTRVQGRDKVNITDGDSHGTMCAGLAASGVNGTGITGVAPECELILIKIDKKAESMADAFRYCGDNKIKVVSVSLGMYPSSTGASSGDIIFSPGVDLSTVFNDSINYAYSQGVTIVSASGNSYATRVSYPAGCDHVIGAGGTMAGSPNLIWKEGGEGSNYNGNVKYVDVFAPSSGIYAPGFDTSKNVSTYWDGGKGTSFSAPIIAGAAALYFQKYPTKTNVDFENALKATCIDISKYNGNIDMGYGRLDVGKLLNISEDIKSIDYQPTTTIKKQASHIHFEDEAGWNIRTLHVYDVTFEKGYGYYDFERYLDYQYGRVATVSYSLEGTKKCWAYSDEDCSGDYFINIGKNIHALPTSYDYYFPWWVKNMTFQFVNNDNWLPKEGVSLSSGYGKVNNCYFWYKGDTDTGVSREIGTAFNYDYPAVKVNINGSSETTSIFDYYEKDGCYYDSNKQVKYLRRILTQDITLYK